MSEFDVTSGRNNFIILQKMLLEIKCRKVNFSAADLKYDTTSAPHFCKRKMFHSLFSDCTRPI